MILAVSDIGKLIINDFVCYFFVSGLPFLTGYQFYPSIFSDSVLGCSIIIGSLPNTFPHIISWTLFLLNIECVFIVFFPLKSMQWFSLRKSIICVLIVIIVCVGICVSAAFEMYPQPAAPAGQNQCSPLGSNAALFSFIYTIVDLFDLYVVPNFLSLFFAIVILLKVRWELMQRARLVHTPGNKANSKASNSVSLSQLSGAIVAAIIAFIRVLFNVPKVAFTTIFFVSSFTDITSAAHAVMLYFIFEVFTCFANLVDFFIYSARIPGFRDILFQRPINKKNTRTHSTNNN